MNWSLLRWPTSADARRPKQQRHSCASWRISNPRAGKNNSTKVYRQVKKRAGFETAIAAFLAELLAAYGDEWRGGWIRCSLDKDERKGHPVTWPQFRNVREAWVAAQLVDTVKGSPGR